MGKHPKTLTIGQIITVATKRPTAMTESRITHGEVLAVEFERMYLKRLCDAKPEDVINHAFSKILEHVL